MCVDGLGYVYVCEGYVVLDQCDESPSLFVLFVRMVVYWGIFGILAFCVSCFFMYANDVLCTRFFSPSI